MPYTIGGGLLLKYGGLLMLDMRKRSIVDSDPIKKEEGMKVEIFVRKNHVTPRIYPYVKVPHYVIYGKGTEVILPLLDNAIKEGILRSSGAWIYWDEKELRWQGKESFRSAMREDPNLLQELKNIVHNDIEKLSEEELKELDINPDKDKEEARLIEIPIEANNEEEE